MWRWQGVLRRVLGVGGRFGCSLGTPFSAGAGVRNGLTRHAHGKLVDGCGDDLWISSKFKALEDSAARANQARVGGVSNRVRTISTLWLWLIRGAECARGTHDGLWITSERNQWNWCLGCVLLQLGALIAQIKADPNYSTFSNQEAVINLMARLNDASAGPKLQTDLVAFNAELNSTIYRDVATLLQAGGDCKWAGDDFEAVHLGVCNGIGGSIDIIWFLLLLVSLFMFGYAIVLAKATKRVAEYYGHSGDLETPLLRPDEHRRPHNYAA